MSRKNANTQSGKDKKGSKTNNSNSVDSLKKTSQNEQLRSKGKSTWVQNPFVRFLKYVFVTYLALNILIPLFVFVWPNVMSHMIFQTFIHMPFKNLSNPSHFGLDNTYAFKLAHDDIQLGAWHILPKEAELRPSSSLEEHFNLNVQNSKADNPPIVVLYLHGNTNDRSTGHRRSLYNLLSSLDYHVIAIDYRGYGDSNGTATEIDVVRDALYTYEYLKKTMPGAKIYIWGHSLGTGITSSMARILSERAKSAEGIILEAPFYNIVEEVELHPFSWIFYPNKLMFKIIEDALLKLELQFRSDIHLTKVSSKIMILHAEDDFVIPIFQGEKLYKTVSENGISKNVSFHRVAWNHGCGHRNIWLAPNITDIISNFII